MRDHQPVILEEFNGFWSRGDIDSCPLDHYTECINQKFVESGHQTRDGLDVVLASGSAIIRSYYYPDASVGEGFLILKADNKIYHVYGTHPSTWTVFTVSSAISGIVDFNYVSINGRAYINLFVSGSEFIYVYKGDGATVMRKAAGVKPVNADGALAAANSATAGNVELGIHIFGTVYETDTGFITQIGPDTLPQVNAPGNKKVDLSAIPKSPNSYVTKRHIVSTKLIDPTLFNGDTRAYQFFYIPNGTINDNTTTTLTVNFYDTELVDDASHLLDARDTIPAGSGIGTYHGRMIVWGGPVTINQVLVSNADEPEAFDSVDGILIVPKEGIGITYCQEYRDILYVAKFSKVYAFNDNQNAPSSWPSSVIDQGLGIGRYGVASVTNYGGIDAEAIIIINDLGVHLFTGIFNKPELSYKIKDYWATLSKTDIRNGNTACYIDSTGQLIYINIPSTNTILVGDFSNGLTAEKIKWSKWTFGASPTSIMLWSKDNILYIGMPTGVHFISVGKTTDTISGSSAVKIPDPTIISALINSQSTDDENIYHFGGAKFRISGTGNLLPKIYTMDDASGTVLATIPMSNTLGKEPFVLANNISQRARLEIKTSAINEIFKVNRIILYTKPIFTSFPQ